MLEDIKSYGLRSTEPPPKRMPLGEFEAGTFVHKRFR